MLILLDNTVLSNFALVARIDLLATGMGGATATPSQVMHEFRDGIARGRLPDTRLAWLEVVELSAEEQRLFEGLAARLNAGEAACLAIAIRRGGRILTDDRDARKLAAQYKVPVSGTIGVLLRLVQIGTLTLPEANDLLGQMIEYGYRSPVSRLDDL